MSVALRELLHDRNARTIVHAMGIKLRKDTTPFVMIPAARRIGNPRAPDVTVTIRSVFSFVGEAIADSQYI